MPSELVLRISDTALALFWGWLLLTSLTAGRLCGPSGFQATRGRRPGQYWFGIFILALMVLHFGGLAWIGQKLD